MAENTQNAIDNENKINTPQQDEPGKVDFVVKVECSEENKFVVVNATYMNEDGSKGFEIRRDIEKSSDPDNVPDRRDIHVHFIGEGAPEDIIYKDDPTFVDYKAYYTEHPDELIIRDDDGNVINEIDIDTVFDHAEEHSNDKENAYIPSLSVKTDMDGESYFHTLVPSDVLRDTPMGEYMGVNLGDSYSYRVETFTPDSLGRESRIDATVYETGDKGTNVTQRSVIFKEYLTNDRVVTTEKITHYGQDHKVEKVEYKVDGLSKAEMSIRHDRVELCDKIQSDLEARAKTDNPQLQRVTDRVISTKIPSVMADFVSSLDKLVDLHSAVQDSESKSPLELSLPDLRDAYIAVAIVDTMAIVPERELGMTVVDKQESLHIGNSYEIFKDFFGSDAGRDVAKQIEDASGIEHIDKRLQQHYSEFTHGIDNSGANFVELTPLLYSDPGKQEPTDFIKQSFVMNGEKYDDKIQKYEQYRETVKDVPGTPVEKHGVSIDGDPFERGQTADGSEGRVDTPDGGDDTRLTSKIDIDPKGLSSVLAANLPLITMAAPATRDYIYQAQGKEGLNAFYKDLKSFNTVLEGLADKKPHSKDAKDSVEQLKGIGDRIVARLDACEKINGAPLDVYKGLDDKDKLKVEIYEKGSRLFTDRSGRMMPGRTPPTDLFSLKAQFDYFALASRTTDADWKEAAGADRPDHAFLKAGLCAIGIIGQIFDPTATLNAYTRALYGAMVDKAATLESAGRKDVEIKLSDEIDIKDASKGAGVVLAEILKNPAGEVSVNLKNYLGEKEYVDLQNNLKGYLETKDPKMLEAVKSSVDKVFVQDKQTADRMERFANAVYDLAYDEKHGKEDYADARPNKHFDSRDTIQGYQLLRATWNAYSSQQTVNFKLPGTDGERDKRVGLGDVVVALYNFINTDVGYTVMKYIYNSIRDPWAESRDAFAKDNIQKIGDVVEKMDIDERIKDVEVDKIGAGDPPTNPDDPNNSDPVDKPDNDNPDNPDKNNSDTDTGDKPEGDSSAEGAVAREEGEGEEPKDRTESGQDPESSVTAEEGDGEEPKEPTETEPEAAVAAEENEGEEPKEPEEAGEGQEGSVANEETEGEEPKEPEEVGEGLEGAVTEEETEGAEPEDPAEVGQETESAVTNEEAEGEDPEDPAEIGQETENAVATEETEGEEPKDQTEAGQGPESSVTNEETEGEEPKDPTEAGQETEAAVTTEETEGEEPKDPTEVGQDPEAAVAATETEGEEPKDPIEVGQEPESAVTTEETEGEEPKDPLEAGQETETAVTTETTEGEEPKDLSEAGQEPAGTVAAEDVKSNEPESVVENGQVPEETTAKEPVSVNEAKPDGEDALTVRERIEDLVASGDPDAAVELCRSARAEGSTAVSDNDFVYALLGALGGAVAAGDADAEAAYKEELSQFAQGYLDNHEYAEAADLFHEIGMDDRAHECMVVANDDADYESAARIANAYFDGVMPDEENMPPVEYFRGLDVDAAMDKYVNQESTSTYQEIYDSIRDEYPETTPQDFNQDVAEYIKSHIEEMSPDQIHGLFDSMHDFEIQAGADESFSNGDLFDQYFSDSGIDPNVFYNADEPVSSSGSGSDGAINNFEEVMPVESGAFETYTEPISTPMSVDSDHIDIDTMTAEQLRDYVFNNEDVDYGAISADTRAAVTDNADLEGLKNDLESGKLDLSDHNTLETIHNLMDNGVLEVADSVKDGIDRAIDNALANTSYEIPDNIQDAIEQGIRDSEINLTGDQLMEIENASMTSTPDETGTMQQDLDNESDPIEAPDSSYNGREFDNNSDYETVDQKDAIREQQDAFRESQDTARDQARDNDSVSRGNDDDSSQRNDMEVGRDLDD